MRKRHAVKLFSELYKDKNINGILQALSDTKQEDIIKLLISKYINKSGVICVNKHYDEQYRVSLDADYADKNSVSVVIRIGKTSYSVLIGDMNLDKFLANIATISTMAAAHT
jgi:chorismate synthase